MNLILLSIIILVTIAALAAVILYIASQKFKVHEDHRIKLVEEILPGVNCGGCGYAGCSAFADACVKSETMEGLYCPVGGSETMQDISVALGVEFAEKHPTVAVVRCNGSCENRKQTNEYNGARTCSVASMTYGGETACTYGCLGYGDCVAVCQFDAIFINKETNLPEVDEEKCTSCGACVKACPKLLIEIRKKGPKSRRIFVSCMNKDKGGIARKACDVACIGCSKCVKVCPFEAIAIADNLAYIDDEKCRLCRKCVPECPTNAIWEVNFPPRKEKTVEKEEDTESKAKQ